MPVINDHIELSDTEQQLFNDLVAAAKQVGCCLLDFHLTIPVR